MFALRLVGVARCASDFEAAAVAFRRDGFAALPGFASPGEVASMKAAMAALEAEYWASPQAAAKLLDIAEVRAPPFRSVANRAWRRHAPPTFRA